MLCMSKFVLYAHFAPRQWIGTPASQFDHSRAEKQSRRAMQNGFKQTGPALSTCINSAYALTDSSTLCKMSQKSIVVKCILLSSPAKQKVVKYNSDSTLGQISIRIIRVTTYMTSCTIQIGHQLLIHNQSDPGRSQMLTKQGEDTSGLLSEYILLEKTVGKGMFRCRCNANEIFRTHVR